MTSETSPEPGPDDPAARMRARLSELREQYRQGEAQLAELARHETQLRETLLRIGGAVQVLEELLPPEPDPPAHPDGRPRVVTVGDPGGPS